MEPTKDMVLTWILNSINPSLATSLEYHTDPRDVWVDLSSRFSHGNNVRLYQLKWTLSSLQQTTNSVHDYYNRMKQIWDELGHLQQSIDLKALQQQADDEKVFQFLLGLNDSFASLRTQILAMDPLPPIGKVFSILFQEEQQRLLNIRPSETIALAVRPGGRPKSSFKCTACRKGRPHPRSLLDHCGGFLSKLECLYVYGCPKLSNVLLPFNLLQRLPGLRLLEIGYCESLEQVFDFEIEGLVDGHKGHEVQLLSSLRELKLKCLPRLKHLFNFHGRIVQLDNLLFIKVTGCHSLKNLFRHFVARNLQKLKKLSAVNCQDLEEIVVEESGGQEEEERVDKIVFASLQTLTLDSLSNLNRFCTGSSPFDWPSLENVKVRRKYLILPKRPKQIIRKKSIWKSMILMHHHVEMTLAKCYKNKYGWTSSLKIAFTFFFYSFCICIASK
ncbi:hypothetical protein F0562_033302 [Nyssa sinensis]|uniref:Retrotransposon gag domain-containing protein n=1 Tax=Nyssa sinensis TaxID=561372 RepID=A0A5J5APX3_9ASTE|nr:hypothetical protein F0562_033302 [Nyssa sinensis]